MTAPWTFGSGRTALWSVGGFTFDLTTSIITQQGNGLLAVSGTVAMVSLSQAMPPRLGFGSMRRVVMTLVPRRAAEAASDLVSL